MFSHILACDRSLKVPLIIVHVSPVKQNWIVIYHCILLRQVLVWQWLVSSALYRLWHCGMVMASLCLLMAWCEIPDVQQERCEVSEDTGQKWKSKCQETTGWWGWGNLKIRIFCSDVWSSEWSIVQKRTRNTFFHKGQVLFTLNQNYIKQREHFFLQWKQIFTPVNISQVELNFKSVCTFTVCIAKRIYWIFPGGENMLIQLNMLTFDILSTPINMHLK